MKGVAEAKAFAEKVIARAAEYVAFAGELGELAKSKSPAAPKAKAPSAKETPAPVTQTERQAVPAAAKKKASVKKTAVKSS